MLQRGQEMAMARAHERTEGHGVSIMGKNEREKLPWARKEIR
jgi:hypothetical protein